MTAAFEIQGNPFLTPTHPTRRVDAFRGSGTCSICRLALGKGPRVSCTCGISVHGDRLGDQSDTQDPRGCADLVEICPGCGRSWWDGSPWGASSPHRADAGDSQAAPVAGARPSPIASSKSKRCPGIDCGKRPWPRWVWKRATPSSCAGRLGRMRTGGDPGMNRPRRNEGLVRLHDQTLSKDLQDLLDRARAQVGGPRPWQARKGIEAQELCAFAMQTLQVDERDPAGAMNPDAARWWRRELHATPLTRAGIIDAESDPLHSADPSHGNHPMQPFDSTSDSTRSIAPAVAALTLEVTDVTGTRSLPARVEGHLAAGAVARSLAARMGLDGSVPWTLREDRSCTFLDDQRPIGEQIEPEAHATLTPKTHLG